MSSIRVCAALARSHVQLGKSSHYGKEVLTFEGLENSICEQFRNRRDQS